MDRILLDTLVTGLPLVPAFLGIYVVLRIRQDFDLSVEGTFALGGAVTGVVLTSTGIHHPLVAMALAVAAGAAVGLATAALNLLLRIPVLMAGLVMNMALFSVTLRVLGTPTVSVVGTETIFSPFIDRPGRHADIVTSLELGAIVLVVLGTFAVFLKTEVGLALRASGINPVMVRSQGVDDRRLLVLSLMLANGLSGLSGNLITQVQGFADVNIGAGMFVSGVGAVLLGVLLLDPSGSRVVRIVAAVLVGGVLYRLILVGALRLGLPAGDLKGITALTLVTAVAAQAHLAPALRRYRAVLRVA
jgi:putative tryptophan/tyrosine transport system permease protein